MAVGRSLEGQATMGVTVDTPVPPETQAAIAEFKEALARYGKAKLKLRASIVENGVTAVDVTAAFVVTR